MEWPLSIGSLAEGAVAEAATDKGKEGEEKRKREIEEARKKHRNKYRSSKTIKFIEIFKNLPNSSKALK